MSIPSHHNARNLHLPMQALGATGTVLPILGYGVSGSLATPLIGEAHANHLIKHARELGVSVFDTAPFYGNGLAEKRLGIGLKHSDADHHFPRPFIITKGGTHRVGRKMWKDFSLEGLSHQLKASRERLPHIDAFFLHGPSNEDLTPQLFKNLEQLKSDGWFQFIGIAGRGPELNTAIASGVFDLLMAPIHKNLPAQDLDRIEKARTQNLGVIAIEALAPAARGIRLSLAPADLWYSARAIAHRKAFLKKQYSADDCLKWVCRSGLADIILSTTTRIDHLRSNAASCTPTLEI
ncbi:aldo/keto reductase [Hirschia litorea]|uniref:Aldo/keto reductase n=1 Tax=Hirschia litorea TaxID=1199156 RepID=A0ABW2ILM5_9PROT